MRGSFLGSDVQGSKGDQRDSRYGGEGGRNGSEINRIGGEIHTQSEGHSEHIGEFDDSSMKKKK
jgi:hypothetical protein